MSTDELRTEVTNAFSNLSREAKIAIIKWILEEDARKKRADA